MRREETVLQLKGVEGREMVNAEVDSVGRRNDNSGKYFCKGIKCEILNTNIWKVNWVQFECGRVFHPTSDPVVD